MPRKKSDPKEKTKKVKKVTPQALEETGQVAEEPNVPVTTEETVSDVPAVMEPTPEEPPQEIPAGEEGDEPPEVMSVDLDAPVELPPGDTAQEDNGEGEEAPSQVPSRSPRSVPLGERQQFFNLKFNSLDRGLTPEEQQEWNSIYASYRGRSAITGTIIGVDAHSISVRNRRTGQMERQTMYCAIVVPYRVRVVIPASEMWEQGQERPDFVLRNAVGATIDFVIIKVDRESGFAIGSRRMALRAQRYFFAHRPALNHQDARLTCRVMSVGPRRCLVECYGHDIDLTQRELRYTAIPDLRTEYHPGQELGCMVKEFDSERDTLKISVKETQSNPYDGAELRHPVGCRRQAVIAGKYGGGVFCNLPDGTVCMCNYAYQHEDADFQVGDKVIIVIRRFEDEKKQIYGKILTKW